ncbi:hypothetical protein LOZ61_002471 [Ophidiomyces ophidiicola]|nr:hypothetical protein LOZ61_002471 [Ophidiomyces ophidiicola]KAI1929554.1 hypothetical protein LOZ60_001576 [Ophidiomyces ophidiicola]KAI2034662.1 hypothetical protein LOZ48_001645 [Ophidiomyces ophidiicola]KAI2035332.1 hypothetical protein LOZ45_000317 [Ophidiomyces ophidiicola]KAI2072054.1 hypothetical protein LOZ40_001459 [Ophidiomyces ophidiicola]
MAQPPHDGPPFSGQAPLPNHRQQQARPTASPTASPTFKHEQQSQALLAQFTSYISPQQSLHPQLFPSQPSAAAYPSCPLPQLQPAPPNVAIQYGVGPAMPVSYYNLPNQHDMYAAQYQTPPPRPQPIPPPATSPSQYPRIQIRPPPLAQPEILSATRLEIPGPAPVATKVEKQKTPLIYAQTPNQQIRPMPPSATQQMKPSTPHSKCEKQPIDYQILLLSLADEYLDAAHSQGTILAASHQEADVEQYYKLVATGLCCIEAVMKNWRLQPRTEALLRLRYARILFEETNNDLEAETALSKGIDLCERNRMFDLKYSMQQLLCRIMFRTNPKASVRMVDGIIRDIEAYRHTAWEYAFRLLRVTLSLSSPPHQDLVAAIHNLQKTASMANRNGDKAIVVVSSIVEALVHLQHSSGGDSVELAQRAIATARSHQLNDTIGDGPHIGTIIQIIDICCSVLDYDIVQASQKLQTLQKYMDQNISNPLWRDDGSFSVPLNREGLRHFAIEFGDIIQEENGNPTLLLNWLPEIDIYSLCYFLSSLTLSAKNSQDGHKAEKYLQEGLRMIRGAFESPQEVSESLMLATARVRWRRLLYLHMLLQQVFLACARTDWPLASRTLKEVHLIFTYLKDGSQDAIGCLIQYATGVLAQATGNLDDALNIFQQPIFLLSQFPHKTCRNDPHRDTAILAGLNCILIHRNPGHVAYMSATNSLAALEPFCQDSPNKYIRAAYSLISATIQTESTMQTKRNLHQSLQAATAIGNSQVTCLALTFMSWKYFRGVVGEQSEKSAMAAKAMARKTDDKLWISVTDELLAETLERQGKTNEAIALRKKADSELARLPAILTKTGKLDSHRKDTSSEMRVKAV